MRPLALGPEQLARVAAVKAHAAANIVPFARVYRMAHGMEATYYNPAFLAEFPVGFRAAYGIEEQERAVLRHLSVSVDGEDRWPHPPAVAMILEVFGMPPIQDCLHAWTEPHAGEERRNLIHVVATYEPGASSRPL